MCFLPLGSRLACLEVFGCKPWSHSSSVARVLRLCHSQCRAASGLLEEEANHQELGKHYHSHWSLVACPGLSKTKSRTPGELLMLLTCKLFCSPRQVPCSSGSYEEPDMVLMGLQVSCPDEQLANSITLADGHPPELFLIVQYVLPTCSFISRSQNYISHTD